ncbi:MAG TPA: sigma-70 family RNA polymerase sigma factor [Hanamia sp.]|nr:sigma-70 family RNA polymerase sigma factor [Hanamia sp.]
MTLKFKYTEQELISRLKNNDQSSFTYLYDHYSAAIYGIIYKMIKDHELSEDVLQETFVKVCYNIKSYDSAKGRLFTWVVSIARHQTIDTINSKSHRNHSKNLNDDYFNSLQSNTNVFSGLDGIGIRKHVSCLKNEQKQIIDLAYFEGYTREEISKELRIPLGTVKTRIRMAIMELRKTLN